MRAARALGHACRLVNVVGWIALGGTGRRARDARDWSTGSAPDFVIVTRHAILAGGARAPGRLRAAARRAFWYFDLQPKPARAPRARARRRSGMYVTSLLAGRRVPRGRHAPACASSRRGGSGARRRPATRVPPALSSATRASSAPGQYPHRHDVLRAVADAWPAADPRTGLGGRRPIFRSPAVRSTVADSREVIARRRDLRSAPTRMPAGAADAPRLEPDVEGARLRRVLPRPLGSRTSTSSRGTATHCAWYRDLAEAVALAERYLAAPEERAPDRDGRSGARAEPPHLRPSSRAAARRPAYGFTPPQTSV